MLAPAARPPYPFHPLAAAVRPASLRLNEPPETSTPRAFSFPLRSPRLWCDGDEVRSVPDRRRMAQRVSVLSHAAPIGRDSQPSESVSYAHLTIAWETRRASPHTGRCWLVRVAVYQFRGCVPEFSYDAVTATLPAPAALVHSTRPPAYRHFHRDSSCAKAASNHIDAFDVCHREGESAPQISDAKTSPSVNRAHNSANLRLRAGPLSRAQISVESTVN